MANTLSHTQSRQSTSPGGSFCIDQKIITEDLNKKSDRDDFFFLASVQRVPDCLIERGDCGEGGLALLSFHVITGHIRIKARNAEL